VLDLAEWDNLVLQHPEFVNKLFLEALIIAEKNLSTQNRGFWGF
jgi:hypothetical protein